jgi:hypothetical protein
MKWRFILIKDGIETEVQEPLEWDTASKDLKRDQDWHGVFFGFGESLKFIEDAYWIIKEEYLVKGVDGDLLLRCEWLCDDCEGWQVFSVGKLDFETYDEECEEYCYISIGVNNSSNEVLVKNRFDTTVDITSNKAYNGATTLTNYSKLGNSISIPSKAIKVISYAHNNADNVSSNYVDDFFWNNGTALQLVYTSIYPGFNAVELTEISSTTFFSSPEYLRGRTFNNLPVEGMVPLIELTDETNLRCGYSGFNIDLNMSGSASQTGGSHIGTDANLIVIKLPKGLSDTDAASFQTLYNQVMWSRTTMTGNATVSFSLQTNFSFTMDIGDRLFYYIWFRKDNTQDFSSFHITMANGSFIRVTATSTCPPTTAKTYMLHETASRIIESITNNQLRFRSEYYGRTDSQPYNYLADGCGGLRTLSNGLQIRQAVLQDGTNPKVFLSLKDLLDSLNAIDCVGFGVEGNDVRVEPVEYFYTDDVIFEADGVNKLGKKVRTDRIYKSFSFGYDKYETETTNGLDAIHTKREYRLQISQSDIKLEKLSKIIADGYAIEVTRRKFGKTEDWRYDQNIFMLCLKRSGSNLIVDQNNIASPANIFDPATVINYAISPIRNGLRWFKWLVQGIRDYAHTALRFSSGEGNYVAKGKLTTGCVNEATVLAENDIISVNSSDVSYDPAPFIIPERVTFTYPLGLHEFAFIAANKYGLIKYRRADDDWQYGWIENIKYSPNEGSADFTLTTKRVAL